MKHVIELHRAARSDIKAITRYYKSLSLSAAEKFVAHFDESLIRYAEFPTSGIKLQGRHRYFQMKKFPYYVFYSELPNGIFVVALCHTSRHPDVWKEMLKNR